MRLEAVVIVTARLMALPSWAEDEAFQNARTDVVRVGSEVDVSVVWRWGG